MSLSRPKPIHVVIIEDQTEVRQDAEMLLSRQTGLIVVGSCASIHDALVLIPATKPDLLLLDINLEDGNAFDLLEQLAPANFKVIFLTAYEKHAIRAIKFGALDYLLKPLDETELQAAITRIPDSRPTTTDHYRIAQQRFKQGTAASRIVLNSQKDSLVVELQDIMYCHSHAGYTTFHLSGNKKIITSRHLKEYEDILPASSFVRPHKSYLVNSSYVSKFQKDGMLVLKDGTAIPVAVRRRYTITGFLNHI